MEATKRKFSKPERVTTPNNGDFYHREDIFNVINQNGGNMYKAHHELNQMFYEDYYKENRHFLILPSLGLTIFSGFNVFRLSQLTIPGKVLSVAGLSFFGLYTAKSLKHFLTFGSAKPAQVVEDKSEAE
ncbi:unnamed protein product [Moneuplotes crassus]|uniref:Uncharacterized protein n=1 Tax=Euplotes crassus TaxID=5936 RepID=A0AAD1Y5F8_EUPCR|nr:unnamed protein product [Moneuplotes crassus]